MGLYDKILKCSSEFDKFSQDQQEITNRQKQLDETFKNLRNDEDNIRELIKNEKSLDPVLAFCFLRYHGSKVLERTGLVKEFISGFEKEVGQKILEFKDESRQPIYQDQIVIPESITIGILKNPGYELRYRTFNGDTSILADIKNSNFCNADGKWKEKKWQDSLTLDNFLDIYVFSKAKNKSNGKLRGFEITCPYNPGSNPDSKLVVGDERVAKYLNSLNIKEP